MGDVLTKTLVKIVEQRGINGQLLFKCHEKEEHMMHLLFSKIDNSGDVDDKQRKLLDFDLRKLKKQTMDNDIVYYYNNAIQQQDEKKATAKQIVKDSVNAVRLVIIEAIVFLRKK